MDFVFGKLINDDLKLANHRADRRGIQHGHVISPLDPSPGDPVTIHVQTDAELEIDHVTLYYTIDGTEPSGSRGVANAGTAVPFRVTRTEWDTLVWGYIRHWEAVIPPQRDGTIVSYSISGWGEDGEVYADWPDPKETVEYATQVFFNGAAPNPDLRPGDPGVERVFAYQVDTLTPPEWARNAVIYHIFLDRFYPGNGRDWLQTEDLNGFCGGTLWGVLDKMDYIHDLGVTCIWLSPTWVSPTAHGYDVADYEHVEPRLGGDEALHAVVKAAHERGIRVLLDMACNHLSNQHPYFQEALSDPESGCRSWFIFDDSTPGYKAFFGVESMPEVNIANPGARSWMIGVAQYYLRDFDIDGFRLDYANGPGPAFWTHFRAGCKAVKPDCWLFGEVIDSSDKLLRYVGRLDGCLNFPTNDALRRTFGWHSWTPERYRTFIANHRDYFPVEFTMPTFLDNHDMDRFSFIAQNDSAALKAAARAQFALPDPVVIYYGTEVGLRQKHSTRDFGLHLSREPMPWGDAQDQDLLTFYRALIRERTQK